MTKLLLDAIKNPLQKKVPAWFMRQAGRYLPEYRQIRQSFKTLHMFKTPEIAEEISLQPIRRFPSLDACIVYADILLIPDALGLELDFVEGEGPVFKKRMFRDVDILENSIETLGYVYETIRRVKPQLPPHVTMLGFAGAPFTVAAYMLEGKSPKGNLGDLKRFIYENESTFHKIMEKLTLETIVYLEHQIEAGVEAVQIFESFAGYISERDYALYCLPYTKAIINKIKTKVPVIHFLGASAHLQEHIFELGADVLSVDWHQNLASLIPKAKKENLVLQGNLDPSLLFAEKSVLQGEVEYLLNLKKNHQFKYIFNLGHGITPSTPIESIELCLNLISDYNRKTDM